MATSGSTSLKISNTSSTPNEFLVLSWARNSYSVADNTSNITVTLKTYSTYGSGAQPWNLLGNTVRLTVGGTQRYNNTNASVDYRGTSASSFTRRSPTKPVRTFPSEPTLTSCDTRRHRNGWTPG